MIFICLCLFTIKIYPHCQENLRGKLEQLSTMYEEVTARMEKLEKAYDDAEKEVGATPDTALGIYVAP